MEISYVITHGPQSSIIDPIVSSEIEGTLIIKVKNKMEKIRCAWCGTDELYQKYHDEEWGVPLHHDQALFEFLILLIFS